jgi:hypothetical protein
MDYTKLLTNDLKDYILDTYEGEVAASDNCITLKTDEEVFCYTSIKRKA